MTTARDGAAMHFTAADALGDTELLPSELRRVLVFASTDSNADRTQKILTDAGITSHICPDIPSLLREAEVGVGVVLATDEALDEDGRDALGQLLKSQPPWSDLPVLVLTRSPSESGIPEDELLSIGNVTLVDRPARVATVVSAVRAAVRSRERQYDQRDRLQAQALLAAVVESSDDAIISKRLDGTIISWNTGAERIFGYTRDEAIGRSITLLIPPDRLSDEQMILDRIGRGDRVTAYETVRRTKSGELINVSLTISPIRDGSNRIVGASKVARDITERARAEAALREADRRKDEFLATLAHELRNPLAPIRNSLHILRVTGPRDSAVERVRDILERQVNHLVRLVDDLMEMSRITRGKIELRREQIELAAVIGSAVEASKPGIDAAGQDLVIAIPPEQLTLEADPVRLAQVFANLLNNASKYSEARTTIWLSARREESEAVVAVRDSGIGIPPEMLQRVFEMFTQVESSLPRAQGGLGIGLTLVRSLVQMHGGTVEARSPGIGRGSELVVRLPLAQTASRVAPEITRAHSASLASQRVLVVDDDRDAADSLGTMLTFLGAEVFVTYGGVSALDITDEFKPNVALVDLGMPGLDGYELARRIREQYGNQEIALIALSGWGSDEDKRRSLEAGFDYHLIKPPDVDALKALMASLGERPRRRGRARAHK
ncbi:MAG: PAS domain-containing hybrid sensor histidine kinase/response regulator [Gemmatimonadaceae bacterium]